MYSYSTCIFENYLELSCVKANIIFFLCVFWQDAMIKDGKVQIYLHVFLISKLVSFLGWYVTKRKRLDSINRNECI